MKTHLGPALFFYVNGSFLFHSCSLEEGEPYGNFLNYPYSHMMVWDRYYANKFFVDFDYYPRGRVVFRKTDNTFLIYYDKCMEPYIDLVTKKYSGRSLELHYDEHYQCHVCNRGYC